MDKITKDILQELLDDPKKPFQNIAKQVGVSPVTAIARIKKLRKQGAIRGTFTIIDLSKIGFQGKAFLFATTSKEYDAEKTIESISKIPNVFIISEIVGRYDLLIMAVFRNISEIREIVNKIRALNAIEKVEVSLSDESYFPVKEEYADIQPLETKKNRKTS